MCIQQEEREKSWQMKLPQQAKTRQSKSQEPKSQEAKSQEPKTQEVKTQEAKSQEPKTQEPKTQESKLQQKNTQQTKPQQTAHYHLPGLFEFYDLYKVFLPFFHEHRECFYEWCDIGSVYGSPADCIWGGGRVELGEYNPQEVLELMERYKISARLTFSNSLLGKEHLQDKRCNELCRIFLNCDSKHNNNYDETITQNGIIIYSDLLLDYIKANYPGFYFVSSTTKVLTKFRDFSNELKRDDYAYVVPDFRLNKKFEELGKLSNEQKNKVEFLCNECCMFGCQDRKKCYEEVSRKNLGLTREEHRCPSPDAGDGYHFYKAMKNPGFIGIDDIREIYMPMGFSNFKIEGRGLGSALVFEFIMYYMTKPEYQLFVRENIYLDNMLDLF